MSAPQQPPSRVLIVKPSSLGDVVTAVPVLRGLRRTFPHARLAWLLAPSCAPIVEHDSDLDEVILFQRRSLGRLHSRSGLAALGGLVRSLRRRGFDWVIDLQGLLRSALVTLASGAPVRAGFADAREGAWLFYNRRVRVCSLHTVDRNVELAAALGVDARGADMTLQVPPAGREYAERFCRAHGLSGRDFVVAVPPARWASKMYPARHWRTVVAALASQTAVAIIGTDTDRPLCAEVARDMPAGVIDLCGQTTVPQMVGLIASCAGVICNDSAAKFIAPAVGTDVVTLIGPTRVELTGPYGRGMAVVADLPCQGCLRRKCAHNVCMQAISPQHVIAAARQMLAAGRA